MKEKRITIRLNIEKYDHRLAYDIYSSVPKRQRSDFIRMAMILMNDRDKQLRRIKKLLLQNGVINVQYDNIGLVQEDMAEPATNMLDFISQLNAQ